MAAQFDKELLERDTKLKSYQSSVWDDIQNLFEQVQNDVHQLRSLSTELQTNKSDRKDLNDLRVKVLSSVDSKADVGEVH